MTSTAGVVPLTMLVVMSTPMMSSTSSSGPILSIPFLLFRFFRSRAFSVYASSTAAVGAIVQFVPRFRCVVKLSRRSLFSRVRLVLIRMPFQCQFFETLFYEVALPFFRQLVEIWR